MDKLNTAGNILTLVGELLCKPFRAREKAREEQTAFRSELTSRLDRISETLRGVSEDIGDLQYERLSQAQDFYVSRGWCPGAKKEMLLKMHSSYRGGGITCQSITRKKYCGFQTNRRKIKGGFWKMKRFVGIILMLLLLPALAMAQEAAVMSGGTELIDWTALVVAVIGVIGTALSALLGRVWVKYVKPWLEQRDLTDAAKIVVEAVEALLGRYCGEDKWKLALQKMADRGFYTESQEVIDALKAAWKQLDMAMIAAGEKDVYGIGEPEKPPEAIV